MTAPFRSSSPRPWLAAGLLLIAFAALSFFDVYLAALERRELAAEARSYFDQAQRLAAGRRYEEAIPLYRRAAALERNDRAYRVAWARALVAAGRYENASPILAEALRDDPNDGPANLEMARILRQQQDTNGAAAYFHRAIYGSWDKASGRDTLTARLELVEMLAGAHRRRELASELPPLEDMSAGNPELQSRVAELFLIAGSPARAAAAFRQLVREKPHDARLYAGLGDAELALGYYRAAQSAYSSALWRGAGAGVRQSLERAAELAQLDPTQRQLSQAERVDRSRRILTRAAAALDQCSFPPDPDRLERQKRAAVLTDRRHRSNDAEQTLAVAEDIWKFVQRRCPQAAERDRTLAMLLERLQQRP